MKLQAIYDALNAYYDANPADPGDHLYDAVHSLQDALWQERNFDPVEHERKQREAACEQASDARSGR